MISYANGQCAGLAGWLLKALNKVKRTKEPAVAIETLQALNTMEIRGDEGSIVQKMRLYNVRR